MQVADFRLLEGFDHGYVEDVAVGTGRRKPRCSNDDRARSCSFNGAEKKKFSPSFSMRNPFSARGILTVPLDEALRQPLKSDFLPLTEPNRVAVRSRAIG